MSERLLALSLHGIWPWAIVNLYKRVENRSPRFAAQVVNRVGDGWLALHATRNVGNRPGKPATREAVEAVSRMATLTAGWAVTPGERCALRCPEGAPEPGTEARFSRGDLSVRLRAADVQTSAIVAVCRVGRVLPPGEAAPWKVIESAAVELLDVRPLTEPVPCKGTQGLWRLPADVHAAVAAQGVLRA